MADLKRVVVTGATGLIGKALCRRLQTAGYAVVVFSRDPAAARAKAPGAAEYVAWDAAGSGSWAAALDGAHAVVNLAGASIAGRRWTEGYKRQLRDSRVVGTRGLVNAMREAATKPRVLINGSAVGYYGFRDDTALDEGAAPGDDFLARLCREWEAEALAAEALGVRTVVVRSGVVLDRDEGPLPLLALPFRLFAGGPVLPGSQWVSWIHLADEVGILMLALENEGMRGPLNATAPRPQTNRAFSRTLGRVLGRPSWAPVPVFALRLALGEFGGTLSEGQRVIPKKAQEAGYEFLYPSSEAALEQIFGS